MYFDFFGSKTECDFNLYPSPLHAANILILSCGGSNWTYREGSLSHMRVQI